MHPHDDASQLSGRGSDEYIFLRKLRIIFSNAPIDHEI